MKSFGQDKGCEMNKLFSTIGKILSFPFTLISAFSTVKKIQNPDEWLNLVKEFKMTPDNQREICKKYSLFRPLILDPETFEPNQEADEYIDYEEHEKTSYNNLDAWKDDLTVIWAGDTKEIEFTYESYNKGKSRRKVKPTELAYDCNKELVIKGICSKSNEERHFKTINFTTMIKVGSQRFDVDDWAEKFLNVELFRIDELIS